VGESRTQYLARKRREAEAYRRQAEVAEAARSTAAWLDRSATARRVAGQFGGLTGLVAGVPKGAFDMGKDALAAANFVSRLMDPVDAQYSAPGQAAWDDVFRAGHGALNYLADRGSKPAKLAGDLNQVGDGVNLRSKPAPLAPTARQEFGNQLQAGMKVGEGVFDTAAAIGGAAELRSIPELRALSKEAASADYMPPGAPQRLIDAMAEPYSGMGSHAPVRRATKLPGGRPVPKALLDSVFNRTLPPEGTPKGAFYRFHYAIDPRYYGGPVKGAFGGGGWSGADLGWTKYGPLARGWYGTPWQTKAAASGVLAGLGWPVDGFGAGEGGQ
jgi:hypothetical protein